MSRSLEAICRKALAADVRQWLADEPVTAWREPLGVRTRRWVRKHPRLVAGTAAALLVGLVASLGGSALLDAKNQELGRTNTRLDEANTELVATNTRLDEAKTKLEQALTNEKTQRRVADDRTRLANTRFTLALEAFKTQVFDANRLLENRPGTQELRKAIMAQAVAGLLKLVKEAEKSQGADRTRAAAHVALGDVYLTLDGRVEKAQREYEIAQGILKRLAAADPRDAQAQRDLSVSFEKIGNVLLQQGGVQKALEQYRESLTIRKRLAEADPRNFEAQTDLVVSHYKIGRVAKQAFRYAEAVASFEKALAVLHPWQKADKLKGTRFAVWPGLIEKERGFCQVALLALGNLDTLLKRPAEQAVLLLGLRVQLLSQQGKYTDAATAADKLAGLAKTGDQHFHAATAFAWCSRDKANADRHAGRTLVCLGKARATGFFTDKKNVARLKTEEAFTPLRSRADFKKLLAELTAKR